MLSRRLILSQGLREIRGLKGGCLDQGVVFENFISWLSWFPWFLKILAWRHKPPPQPNPKICKIQRFVLRSQPPFTGVLRGPGRVLFECFWAPAPECPKLLETSVKLSEQCPSVCYVSAFLQPAEILASSASSCPMML